MPDALRQIEVGKCLKPFWDDFTNEPAVFGHKATTCSRQIRYVPESLEVHVFSRAQWREGPIIDTGLADRNVVNRVV